MTLKVYNVAADPDRADPAVSHPPTSIERRTALVIDPKSQRKATLSTIPVYWRKAAGETLGPRVDEKAAGIGARRLREIRNAVETRSGYSAGIRRASSGTSIPAVGSSTRGS
jgi:hypothetical protein